MKKVILISALSSLVACGGGGGGGGGENNGGGTADGFGVLESPPNVEGMTRDQVAVTGNGFYVSYSSEDASNNDLTNTVIVKYEAYSYDYVFDFSGRYLRDMSARFDTVGGEFNPLLIFSDENSETQIYEGTYKLAQIDRVVCCSFISQEVKSLNPKIYMGSLYGEYYYDTNVDVRFSDINNGRSPNADGVYIQDMIGTENAVYAITDYAVYQLGSDTVFDFNEIILKVLPDQYDTLWVLTGSNIYEIAGDEVRLRASINLNDGVVPSSGFSIGSGNMVQDSRNLYLPNGILVEKLGGNVCSYFPENYYEKLLRTDLESFQRGVQMMAEGPIAIDDGVLYGTGGFNPDAIVTYKIPFELSSCDYFNNN